MSDPETQSGSLATTPTASIVYQLQTSPGETDRPIGWRLLDTAKIEAPVVLDTTFRGSRGAAHRNHYTWDKVHARVG